MQNPGQTRIFYKASQTRLTQAKCDPVDPDDPDDLTRLQHWPTRAWFLEIVSSVNVTVGVCMCLLPRVLITSHMKGIRNNQIRQFYGFSISLYDLDIDKLNGRGLSNTWCHEFLAK